MTAPAMGSAAANRQVLLDFIQAVWRDGHIDRLAQFWTEDCVNHAAPRPDNRGLDALCGYHEGFVTAFAAFADVQINVERQVAEADLVVTHIRMTARHVQAFMSMPARGRMVALASMRIDRLRDGRIAEHWSVADMAGLMQQLAG